jgi:hypothetical protein
MALARSERHVKTVGEQLEALRKQAFDFPNRGSQIRARARALCSARSVDVPDWAASRLSVRFPEASKELERLQGIAAARSTSASRARILARELCRAHGLELPDWAQLRRGSPKPAPAALASSCAEQLNTPAARAVEVPAAAVGILRAWRCAAPLRAFSARADRVTLTEYVEGRGERRARYTAIELAVVAVISGSVQWETAQ